MVLSRYQNKNHTGNIPEALWPLIRAEIALAKDKFGPSIYSIYICGSTCRGNYREGSSDLDLYYILDFEPDHSEVQQFILECDALLQLYPVVPKVDVKVYYCGDLSISQSYEADRFLIKTDCVLLQGDDPIPDYQIPTDPQKIARYKYEEKARVIDQVARSISATSDPKKLGGQLAKQFIRLVYLVSYSGGEVPLTYNFEVVRATAQNACPVLRKHTVWAEQILESPPTTPEQLKETYKDGQRRLLVFEKLLTN